MNCGRVPPYCDFFPTQPIDLTLPKATPECVVTKELKRKQYCQKCQNHGMQNIVKGHKRRGCPKEHCFCELCDLTVKKRNVMRQTIAVRRLQAEEKESGNYAPPKEEKPIYSGATNKYDYGKLLEGYDKHSVNEKAVAFVMNHLQRYFLKFSINIAELVEYYPTGNNQFDELNKRVHFDRQCLSEEECVQYDYYGYSPVKNERAKHYITNHSHHNHAHTHTHTHPHTHARRDASLARVDAIPQHNVQYVSITGDITGVGSTDIHRKLWRSWDHTSAIS